MPTIDIPGGQATFRSKLTKRQRNLIDHAGFDLVTLGARFEKAKIPLDESTPPSPTQIAEVQLNGDDMELMGALANAQIVAFLESWTLNEPIPTRDTVEDLDEELYNALALEAAKLANAAKAATDFSPGASPRPDDSPTGLSGPSDGLSRADVQPLTPGPKSTSGSSATANLSAV